MPRYKRSIRRRRQLAREVIRRKSLDPRYQDGPVTVRNAAGDIIRTEDSTPEKKARHARRQLLSPRKPTRRK